MKMNGAIHILGNTAVTLCNHRQCNTRIDDALSGIKELSRANATIRPQHIELNIQCKLRKISGGHPHH